MNRQGSFHLAGEQLIWLFRILMIIIVVVYLAVVVAAYVNKKIDTSRLEQKIIIDKVMMQPGCLNYFDVRWQPYSIDVKKFNSDSLDNCLEASNIGLRMELEYGEKKLEARYNEKILGLLAGCGKQKFSCYRDGILVRVFDNAKQYNGVVRYEVIIKNE